MNEALNIDVKHTEKIWMDGKTVPWENASVHIMTHSLHYGSAIFEGIRCYKTDKGSMIFRLNDHVKRLYRSAKIYGMKIPFSPEEISSGIKSVIVENHIDECYIRPIVYYGWDEPGINPYGNKVHASIAIWPWLPYLGEEGLRKGVRCKVSSWVRIDPRSLPMTAKASANYANSILAKTESKKAGYDEAILLNNSGMVAEATGENLFMVSEGKILTPPLSTGILPGITRESIIQVGRDIGLHVEERNFGRGELVLADEVFLTGTAAEVTPVREVDDEQIGNGARGPITERIQAEFFDIVRGRNPRYNSWLEPLG